MRKMSFSGVLGIVRELVAAKCSRPVLVTPSNSPVQEKKKQTYNLQEFLSRVHPTACISEAYPCIIFENHKYIII